MKKNNDQITNRLTPIILSFTLTIIWAGATATFAQNPHFTTIDYPGATLTVATGVNTNGDIVGYYIPSGSTRQRGFVLRDGVFTSFVVPGAYSTFAFGINDAGEISGTYIRVINQVGYPYGFLRLADSTINTIQYDASTSTQVFGINNDGVLIGAFWDAAAGYTKSFSWHNGVFTVFEAPFPGMTSTYAHSANDAGEIVGAYYTGNPNHGFRLLADGTYVSNDFPDAIATVNWGVSSSSLVVGEYTDMTNVTHAFLMKNGEYSVFDFPEATYTVAVGIAETNPFDRKGMRKLLIVGGYRDANGLGHGFLFKRQIGVGKGEFK